MTVLNEAAAIYLGNTDADAVYLGDEKVWPPAPVGEHPYVLAVLADAPIAYWRLTERSGTVARDHSGHDLDATYSVDVGLPTNYRPTPGPIGYTAIRFADVPPVTAVALPAGLQILAGSEITIELFRRLSTHPSAGTEFVCHIGTLTGVGRCTVLLPWSGQTYFNYGRNPAGSTYGQLQTAIGAWGTAWHHFVATATQTTLSIYINGSLAASGPYGGPHTAALSAGVLGAYQSPALTYWSYGALAEVAVYDYALSAQRIADHYAASQP